MKLIVGLGNPEDQYSSTWHNMGFLVLDRWAEEQRLGRRSGTRASSWKKAFRGRILETGIAGEPVVLLKPMTFMNRSGESVAPAVERFRIQPRDLLVVHDDIDLRKGRLQLRFDIGAAGHKGILSIINGLDSKTFYRLRVGIAPEEKVEDVTRYVLKPWQNEEREEALAIAGRAVQALDSFIRVGPTRTMNLLHAPNDREPAGT